MKIAVLFDKKQAASIVLSWPLARSLGAKILIPHHFKKSAFPCWLSVVFKNTVLLQDTLKNLLLPLIHHCDLLFKNPFSPNKYISICSCHMALQFQESCWHGPTLSGNKEDQRSKYKTDYKQTNKVSDNKTGSDTQIDPEIWTFGGHFVHLYSFCSSLH